MPFFLEKTRGLCPQKTKNAALKRAENQSAGGVPPPLSLRLRLRAGLAPPGESFALPRPAGRPPLRGAFGLACKGEDCF
jgi:hypothetical protein